MYRQTWKLDREGKFTSIRHGLRYCHHCEEVKEVIETILTKGVDEEGGEDGEYGEAGAAKYGNNCEECQQTIWDTMTRFYPALCSSCSVHKWQTKE